MKRALRILHCPTNVAAHPQGLAEAERALGHESLCLALRESPFGYRTDKVLFAPADSRAAQLVKLIGWMVRSVLRYDVLHYNFGCSLYVRYAGWARVLSFIDVRVARLLGRVVAMSFLGTDARQGAHCTANYAIHIGQGDASYFSDESGERKRRTVAFFARHAHIIYATNPDLLHVLPTRAKYLPYCSVDPRQWKAVGVAEDVARPHVIHAPSHRGIKGTKAILAVVERLKAEGVDFEFTLAEKLPYDEVCALYARADLLVEQLYLGYYGVLATEMMALAKPVMSYIRTEDLVFVPEEMRAEIPVISITEDTLYDTLKSWLTTRKSELAERGRAGRRYVEKWHDPQRIAAQVCADYEAARV